MAVGDFEAYMPQEFDGAPYGRDGILRTMDEAGIDFSVVFPGGLPPDPRAINAELLTALKGQDRLLPGCLINPTLGPLAVDELRRCVDAGARSMKLMAAAHGYRLDGPAPDAVMAVAAEIGLPVTIHSGSEVSGCSPAYIGTLAARHPEVTIIMDHMGYREWVGLAVQAAAANPRIFLGTTLIAAAEPITIKNIIQEGRVGAGRIVFGSNAPSGAAVNGVRGIRGLGLVAADEAAVLGGNLASIYGV